MTTDKRSNYLGFLSLFMFSILIPPSLIANGLDSKSKSVLVPAFQPQVVTQQYNFSKVAKLDVAKIAENEVSQYFVQAVSKIDHLLFTQQKTLKKEPSKLNEFVNSELLPLWNSERTLKLLLGSSKWKALTVREVDGLKQVFDQTMHRYVNEGMKFYDGQRIKLSSVKLNEAQTKGIATIEISPIYLPAFKISFRILKSDEQWQLYDILVEGISYVKLKKNEYRRIIDQQGIAKLLAYLDEKNLPNR